MKYFILLLTLLHLVSVFADSSQPILTEKMPVVVFRGEGGGWNPSLARCRSALAVLSEYLSIKNASGFLSFNGECTDDAFDKEWPKNLYFASIMKLYVRTNLQKGLYSSQTFCLNSSTLARTVAVASTQKTKISLRIDETKICEDKELSPVRVEVRIE